MAKSNLRNFLIETGKIYNETYDDLSDGCLPLWVASPLAIIMMILLLSSVILAKTLIQFWAGFFFALGAVFCLEWFGVFERLVG